VLLFPVAPCCFVDFSEATSNFLGKLMKFLQLIASATFLVCVNGFYFNFESIYRVYRGAVCKPTEILPAIVTGAQSSPSAMDLTRGDTPLISSGKDSKRSEGAPFLKRSLHQCGTASGKEIQGCLRFRWCCGLVMLNCESVCLPKFYPPLLQVASLLRRWL
jgi:hypothetical protein